MADECKWYPDAPRKRFPYDNICPAKLLGTTANGSEVWAPLGNTMSSYVRIEDVDSKRAHFIYDPGYGFRRMIPNPVQGTPMASGVVQRGSSGD